MPKHVDPFDTKELVTFDRVASRPTTPTRGARSGASRRVSLQSGSSYAPGQNTNGTIVKTSAHDSPSIFTAKAEVAFNKFALTEGGSHTMLPVSSVQNAIYALGLNPAASRITTALERDGYSKRGLILQDFIKMAEQFQATSASLHSTIKNFKVLDSDNDDKISRDQFREYIQSLPKKDRIEGRSLEEVMNTLDPDTTGMINLKAFLKGLFIDLTEEEIIAAMKEHGYDPDREEREREQQRLANQAAAEKSWQENYDALLSDERMLRTEINAELKSESKPIEAHYNTVIAEALATFEKERGEQSEAERRQRELDRERAAAEAEAKAAAKAAEEAERKKKEEEEEKNRKAEEDRKKKEKEEAERKRKEEEEKKKAAAAAQPKPFDANGADSKDKAKKDEGGCCVVM